MRRRPGELLPIEAAVCVAAVSLRKRGLHEFHGYELAKHLTTEAERRQLTAYGTLYRALGRLEQMGHLSSRWEDPAVAAAENRPGRRLYTLTPSGLAAGAAARRENRRPGLRVRRRVATA